MHETDANIKKSSGEITSEEPVKSGYRGFDNISERKKPLDALRESEEKHRLLLEYAGFGIGYYDLSGKILLLNREALRQLGGKAEDYIGKSAHDVFGVELGQIILERIAEVSKSDEDQRYEDHVDLPTGRKYFISVYNRIMDATGNCIGVQIISNDITERKETEDSLKKHKDMLHAILNSAPITIFATDDQGVFTLHKGKATERVHMKPDENVGVSAFKLYDSLPFLEHPDKVTTGGSILRRVLKGETVTGITELRGIHFDNHLAPIRDTNDYVIGAVGIATDVTRQIEAENLLRRERDRAQKYLDVAAVMMVVIDSQQRLSLINQKGCEILGYEEGEILGRNWFENFLPARIKDEVKSIFEKLVRGQVEALEHVENPVVTKDGRERLIAWCNTLLKDDKGNIIGILSSGEDITDRRKAEEELREYQLKLKAMASQLSRAQELERQQLSKRLHDGVNQRLIMAKLTLQQCAQSIVDNDLSKKLEDVSTEMREIVEDSYSLMLELSNPILYESGLVAALKALLESRLFANQDIVWKLKTFETHFELDQDTRIILYQGVREMLVNTIKHAKAKKVEVAIQKEHDGLRISVKDDGIGFDSSIEKQPSIEGGFGLFNLKESLETIEGKMEIVSKSGQGTVVTITVPLISQSALSYEGRNNL